MTTTQHSVDRGLEIRAQIEQLKEELDIIESSLQLTARQGQQIDLNDPDREGKQYLAHGTEVIVPVVLTADVIIGQFVDDSPMHARLEAIAGESLKHLFKKKTIWENLAKSGKQFRTLANQTLEAKGPEFITAAIARDKHGIPKSSIKVEWNRAGDINP